MKTKDEMKIEKLENKVSELTRKIFDLKSKVSNSERDRRSVEMFYLRMLKGCVNRGCDRSKELGNKTYYRG